MSVTVKPTMCSLAYHDFWPSCLHAEEGFMNARFERFDILVPRANNWLRQNPRAEVTKCQTLEKRVTSPEQLMQNSLQSELPKFHNNVYFVKGLRLWYYIISPSYTNPHPPVQIGYRNFLPRCVDMPPDDWPEFENLTELYIKINNELDTHPIEGSILTVETLALHVDADQLSDLATLQVDQCQWPDSTETSVLYVTRIFYCFQCPAYEQVGAADFFPDHQIAAPSPNFVFSSFSTIIAKVNCWLTKVKDIRITNIQTLETVYDPSDSEEKLETSTNFLPPEAGSPLIRFIRVMYVRPKYGMPPGGLHTPSAIWFKNFVPLTLLHEGKGSTQKLDPCHETLSAIWDRVKDWQKKDNKNVLDVEMLYYPLSILQQEHEDIETTVLPNLSHHMLIEVLRVYYNCSEAKQKIGKQSHTKSKTSCVMA